MRHRHLARPDPAAAPLDLHFGDDGDPRAAALRVGDAAPGELVTGLTALRRRAGVPFRPLCRRLDHRDVARIREMTQAEFDRVGICSGRHLVDERLAGEMDLRPDRIAQVRGAQRRGAVEQRRYGLPGEPLVLDGIGFSRRAEAVARLQRDAHRLAGERVVRLAAVGVHVDT